MKSLQEIFPKASKSFVAANPQLGAQEQPKTSTAVNVVTKRAIPDKMNKTEREFSLILEAHKRQGDIQRWDYEGITLRWGGLRYTPDFVVFYAAELQTISYQAIKLIETKGAFIREDAMVKFKAARAHWPEFTFELHQRTKLGWRQIY